MGSGYVLDFSTGHSVNSLKSTSSAARRAASAPTWRRISSSEKRVLPSHSSTSTRVAFPWPLRCQGAKRCVCRRWRSSRRKPPHRKEPFFSRTPSTRAGRIWTASRTRRSRLSGSASGGWPSGWARRTSHVDAPAGRRQFSLATGTCRRTSGHPAASEGPRRCAALLGPVSLRQRRSQPPVRPRAGRS